MLRPMFGMGGTEILVILVVAMIFLGPEKLPEAAAKISKGIRDIRKQQRELTQTIENDTEIGGAIRDLKSALRGDEYPARPPVRVQPKLAEPTPAIDSPHATTGGHDDAGEHADGDTAGEIAANAGPDATAGEAPPALTLPMSAGEADPDSGAIPTADELGHLIKPAAGTVAKKHG
jgi:sec-independent protein translocase protein TatB